ncbi:abortive infection family protein [Enterococcus thailandicus]|uniref:abortive infection family protein n=1 Tax=Enterococcus thailandicus TaxID=417368 RepID=UPI0022E0EB0D|nr:abortive infection family protein [Enterococcus thailandicus]
MRVNQAKEIAEYFSLGSPGYVMDFNNKQWDEFTNESIGLELQQIFSGSKGSSLISFLSSNDYSDTLKFKLICDLDEVMEDHNMILQEKEADKFVRIQKNPIVKQMIEKAHKSLSLTLINMPSFTNEISLEYIKNLPSRIEYDLEIGNYDSVLTKSNTMVDEVLKYIIENSNVNVDMKTVQSKKLRNIVFSELNMKIRNDSDKRVKKLVSSLNSLSDSILELRNNQSDAHAYGENRVKISKDEAVLVANSAMVFCEYIYSVFRRQKNKID